MPHANFFQEFLFVKISKAATWLINSELYADDLKRKPDQSAAEPAVKMTDTADCGLPTG
jgi:hypothetical protein